MEENTDIIDETLENQSTIGSEKSSAVSFNENGNLTKDQKRKFMEVHKHPHHVTHKKKWPEYLLEFFMLFLAVFLGFIAENMREKYIERQREKEYIHSMINDLQSDTLKLGINIAKFQKELLMQDTLIKTIPMLDKGFNQAFHRNFNGIEGFPDFIYSDATIQQLKNSGGFRLIRNPKVVGRIMAYDGIVKKALINEANLGRTLEKIADRNNNIFNNQYLDKQIQQGRTITQLEAEKFDVLLSHDKIILSKYYNNVLYYSWICNIVKNNMKDVKLSAVKLIHYLQKEYHLENE